MPGTEEAAMTITETLAQARTAAEAGNLSYAEMLCRQVLLAEPQCVDALMLLAALCQVQGRIGESIALCQQSLQIDPRCADAHRTLANLHAARGDLDGAAAALERAVALRPDDSTAWNDLGLIRVRQQVAGRGPPLLRPGGRAAAGPRTGAQQSRQHAADAAAAGQGRRLLSRRAASAARRCAVLGNLGVACAALEQWEEAAAAWRRSLALQPDDPHTHRHLAQALVHLERPAEALPHCRHLLAQNPTDTELRLLVDILSGTASWTRLPADYVTQMFDGYADTFDQDLVGRSITRGPPCCTPPWSRRRSRAVSTSSTSVVGPVCAAWSFARGRERWSASICRHA